MIEKITLVQDWSWYVPCLQGYKQSTLPLGLVRTHCDGLHTKACEDTP